MKLKTDKLTSILGVLAASLVMQQTYAPELLSQEEVAPIMALLVTFYGAATNKDEIEVPFTEITLKKRRICELEAEIQQLKEELAASRSFFPEPEDKENREGKEDR